jgi:hypothetical protein
MISELNDEEILELLMSSEFNNDYKPEEFKYLLFKWRYFYRILHGKYELEKTDHKGSVNRLKVDISNRDNRINSILYQLRETNDKIDSLKNRKLTFKERISGKIKFDKNENFM